METQNKFKMTFSNSWWQCLVALLLYYPARAVVIFPLVFSHIGLSDKDISSFANIIGLVFVIWFAHRLSYSTWKKKQKRLETV